jgi:UDP-N-acetyl-D-mannosaminuronate dehydrogenase
MTDSAASLAKRSPCLVGLSRRTLEIVSLELRIQELTKARESPAITIANHFLSEKARINIYDPQVTEPQIWLDLTE